MTAKMPVKSGVTILSFVFLASCAHRPVYLSPAAAREKSDYEDGLKALAKKDFRAGVDKFNDLLSLFPTTRWLAGAYYNLGVAYEGLGQYAEAAANYKKVIEFYEDLPTRDETEAVYRYSICEEYLGDDDKMLLALLQLQDRSQFLTKDQVEVEVPARTAAAYARLGNMEEARKYFSASEAGLKKMRRAHVNGDLLAWLPKTLYSMGRIPPHPHDATDAHFKNYLAGLEQAQERLLRAAELGNNNWSKRAAAELMAAYNEAWDWIDKLEVPPDPDPLQFAKAKQERQRAMAADFDVTIDHLKLARIPPSPQEPELPQVAEIFKLAHSLQHKLDILIGSPDIQDQETPESQKRNGLKRAGKIIVPK